MHTIKTPSTFTIDPRRYHIKRETIPQQTPEGITPSIEIGMDYALLAADLEVMGYPDELTEAIRALDPDHGGQPVAMHDPDSGKTPTASIYDHATQMWEPMTAADIESTTDPDSEQQDGE